MPTTGCRQLRASGVPFIPGCEPTFARIPPGALRNGVRAVPSIPSARIESRGALKVSLKPHAPTTIQRTH
jgi:hypothetical protein